MMATTKIYIFQFTPLREGRPGREVQQAGNQAISIHAPTRGATVSALASSCWVYRFQFTPLREGRLSSLGITTVAAIFQFTPLREGRLIQLCLRYLPAGISIHAPTRGATHGHPCFPAAEDHFNSRPYARGDQDANHGL